MASDMQLENESIRVYVCSVPRVVGRAEYQAPIVYLRDQRLYAYKCITLLVYTRIHTYIHIISLNVRGGRPRE